MKNVNGQAGTKAGAAASAAADEEQGSTNLANLANEKGLALAEHVELRNLAKLAARDITPYRVLADGMTVEAWYDAEGKWAWLSKHPTKTACERWRRNKDTRTSCIPVRSLNKFGKRPFLGRAVRLERTYGQHAYTVKESPGWRHVARIEPGDFDAAVRALADDDVTVIDTNPEEIARMAQEAAAASAAAGTDEEKGSTNLANLAKEENWLSFSREVK